jgi:hypothetical protein
MSLKKNKISSRLKSISGILILLFLMHTLSSHKSFTISHQPPEIKDTIWVYDTIFQYDTIYIYETIHDTVFLHDTVKLSENTDSIPKEKTNYFFNFSLKIPELKHKPKYYLGPDISVFMTDNFIMSNQSTNNDIYELYKNSFKLFPGVSLGLSFHVDYNNYILQTGINLTDFIEKFEFVNQNLKIDTLEFFEYFQNSLLDIDTIWYVDLDSLLQGDTIWKQHIDTTLLIFQDSILVTNYDTTINVISKRSYNHLSYFEIPLIFGYNFSFKKISIAPKAGIIIGFLSYTNGKIFNYNGNFSIVDLQTECSFPIISFSTFLAVNLRYKINKKTFVYIEPFFRNNLSGTYYNEYFTKKYFSYGIKFGFSFVL